MSIVGRKVAAMLTLLAIMIFVIGVSSVQAENVEQVKDEFRKAINAFEEGNFKEARTHFAAVLNLSPSKELAAELRDAATVRYLLQIARNEAIGPDVWRLISLADQYDMENARKPENIQKLVADLDKGADSRKIAMFELLKIGAFAVPYLKPHLADKTSEDGMRSYAYITILKMGPVAVQPLIEMLNSNEDLLVSNCCYILSALGDERAVPYLLQIALNEKANKAIRTVAASAFLEITGVKVGDAAPLQNYFYNEALRYYLNDPVVQEEAYSAEDIIWRWDAEKKNVVATEIPRFAFNEEIARERCYDGLGVAAASEIFTPMLVCLGVSQANDTFVRHASLTAVASKLEEGAPERGGILAEIATLAPELKKAKRFEIASYLVGQKNLLLALNIALENGKELDARSIIQFLAEVSDGSLLPSPGTTHVRTIGSSLIDALDSPSSLVRYNAAVALGKINPVKPFFGQEKVALTLAAAVGDTSDINVLVVNNDIPVMNKTVQSVREAGYGAQGVMSGRSCLGNAGIFPIKDIILLDYVLDDDGDINVDEVYRRLKDEAHTASIPIVFIVPEAMVGEFQAKFPAGKYFVTAPIDDMQLVSVLKKVVQDEKLENAVRKEVNTLAILAAQTMAKIPVDRTFIDLRVALKPLVAAFKSPLDEVRVGAMKTVANLKAAEALAPLMEVFKDTNNSSIVRITSLEAIGAIDPARARDLLVEAVGDADYDIARAAATALGKKDFDPELINKLLKKSLNQ